ncbi:MAG: hypothetical protein JWP91_1768 [Fibrobacteres bacterium]|nr:hypothetical protein [Fibrobacterota bacterium]
MPPTPYPGISPVTGRDPAARVMPVTGSGPSRTAFWAAFFLAAALFPGSPRAAKTIEVLEAGEPPAVEAAPAPDSGTAAPMVPDSNKTDPMAIPTAPQAMEAQGPDDLTIEVDPGQSRNKDKSLPLAMLFSAALPGSGELYLHEQGNAKAFLLTEAGFWASLYVAFMARESYLSSARNYASEYAGIDASSKSPAFLETMAGFRSYQEKQHRQDSYELAQILSGKRDRDYDIAPVEANYWDFGSSVNPENTRNWRTFQQSLRYYRASKVAISFAIGALALNRLASLANTLRVYKRTSAKGLGLQVFPEIGPDYTGARVSLGF